MTERMELPSPTCSSIARLFFKLGTIGFGGPAAHVAMMQDEVVERRKWLKQEDFIDLLGAAHLIPGPNSTELAIHIGHRKGGWRGLIMAGISFIFPAVFITGIIAAAYVKWGSLPQVAPVFAGIKPIVVAIIAAALVRIGRSAVKDWRLFLVGVAVAVVAYQHGFEVVALLGGGFCGMIWRGLKRSPPAPLFWTGVATNLAASSSVLSASLTTGGAVSASGVFAGPLWILGIFFLKVGAVLFGSGYVLFAFLEGGLVDELGLLTTKQLLDAIMVGQFTPGPVLSTATFIGYVIAGPWGAVVATIAIFLPSFLYVVAVNPLIPKLRKSHWASCFLDGVNVSAVGLMLVVTVKLGEASLIDGFSCWLSGVAFLLIAFKEISPGWLILAGAVTGYILSM